MQTLFRPSSSLLARCWPSPSTSYGQATRHKLLPLITTRSSSSTRTRKGNHPPKPTRTGGTVSADSLFTRRLPDKPQPPEPYRPPPLPDKYSIFPIFPSAAREAQRTSSGGIKNVTLTFWETGYRSILRERAIQQGLEPLYGRKLTAEERKRAVHAVSMYARYPNTYLGEGQAARVLREIAVEHSKPYSVKGFASMQAEARQFKWKMLRDSLRIIGGVSLALLVGCLLLR